MTTLTEIVSNYFEFLEEMKRNDLLSKPKFGYIYKNRPIYEEFIFEMTHRDINEEKKYEYPELKNVLDFIFSDKEKIKQFAQWLNESNRLKKSFKYYEKYNNICEMTLWNGEETVISPNRAWSLLTSQVYEDYMKFYLLKYISI